jgi:hypothetical protein
VPLNNINSKEKTLQHIDGSTADITVFRGNGANHSGQKVATVERLPEQAKKNIPISC